LPADTLPVFARILASLAIGSAVVATASDHEQGKAASRRNGAAINSRAVVSSPPQHCANVDASVVSGGPSIVERPQAVYRAARGNFSGTDIHAAPSAWAKPRHDRQPRWFC
jgi:hypothetical protein